MIGWTRAGPIITVLLLGLPVLLGLLGTILPAFGYFPALGGVEFSLAPMRDMLAQPGLGRSAWLSLSTGLIATLISLLLVLFFIAGFAGTRSFAFLQRVLAPLLSIPHAAAAFGLAFMIAPSGLLVRMISPELTGWTRPPDLLIINDPQGLSLIAGLVMKEMPFLFLIALAGLPQVDLHRAHASIASLGYGRVAGFILAIWPQLYRQMRLAIFATIAFSTSVVDVAAILGPSNPPVLSLRLLQWMSDPDLALRFRAAAGALLQLGLSLLAILIWIMLERIGGRLSRDMARRGCRFAKDRPLRILALIATMGPALLMLGGIGALALWSVAGFWSFPDLLPSELSLRAWQTTLPRLAAPLGTTLIVAGAATLIALVLVILCLANEDRRGRKSGHGALFMIYLPLLVPQIAFLFGLQLFFLLLDADATMGALILVHLIFVLPYVFLSLGDVWRSFDGRILNIAAGLGASPARRLFAIKLPMLLRAILVAGAVGFAVSIGQYLPTILIGVGRLTTITSEAVALSSGGNRRIIGIWALLQALLPFLGFAIATMIPALIFQRFRAMRV